MRWFVIKKLLVFSLLSLLVLWSFLGLSDKEITSSTNQISRIIHHSKYPEFHDEVLTSIDDKNQQYHDRENKKSTQAKGITTPLQLSQKIPTNVSKIFHRRITTQSTQIQFDPDEQLRREIYGNNYLEELVLVGADNELLYGEVAHSQLFGSCSKWTWSDTETCSDYPLLNLLRKGFRYFELTAYFDPYTRLYYWYLPSGHRGNILREEMSRDVREICPFVRDHSGEMFIFALSFCTSDCNEIISYEDDSTSFNRGYYNDWTKNLPENSAGQQAHNRSFYSNPAYPGYPSQKLNIINTWFSNDKPLVENPIASRFLSIVGSFVKNCALSGDVPLTRTVSEMLMLQRNVIFTVRSPTFLIPLALQQIFRHDEILRKTIWSDLKTNRRQKIEINNLFPETSETKNLRFFTQPSTLSHLRLIFYENREVTWLNKWKGIVIFPSGCAVFDVSLVLLMACLLLIVLRSSLRRSSLTGLKFDYSAGKIYPFRKSSSSAMIFYLLYALFFICFLLANLYAYQCFPKVILPFSHHEMDQSSNPGLNLTYGWKNMENLSNYTRRNNGNDNLCDSIVWMFRRWMGRTYGKRVNIISVVSRLSLSSLTSSQPTSLSSSFHNQLLSNLSSLGLTEIDVCTNELINFSTKVNYNLIKRHIILKHSGSPLSNKINQDHLLVDCLPVVFTYSISSNGKHLQSGIIKNGDEIIFEDDVFPKDAELRIRILKQYDSTSKLLYSEILEKLMKNHTDVFLRGAGSTSGFAYVSNRPDVTLSSCQMKDVPRNSAVMKVGTWSD